MKYRLKKKNILILCGILVGIVLLNYAYTYAKYVANSTWNYYLQSKEFFFSSDSLDSEGFKNVNTTIPLCSLSLISSAVVALITLIVLC